MIPVIGFFEYGIAAVLGTVAMMVLVGWGLAADGAPGNGTDTRQDDEWVDAPVLDAYRKAA